MSSTDSDNGRHFSILRKSGRNARLVMQVNVMSERTTSSSWAMGIVKALEMDGLDCRAMFGQLGLDFEALDDPDARFPRTP